MPLDGDFEDGEHFEDLVALATRELEVARRRARAILANARVEAYEICQQARLEAAQLLEGARARAEVEAHSRRTEIEAEARDAARAEGLELAALESRGALAIARQLRNGLESAYRNHMREAEKEILETVLTIAERVVAVEQRAFADVLGSAIHGVLMDRLAAVEVQLQLNPADYDAVFAYLCQTGNESGGACDRIAGINALASVPRGTCQLRSTAFNLDLSVDRRFGQVAEQLRRQHELSAAQPRE